MKNTFIGLLVGTGLSACAMLEEMTMSVEQDEQLQQDFEVTTPVPVENSQPLNSSMIFQQQFANSLSRNQQQANEITRQQYNGNLTFNNDATELSISASKHNINHYARGLMQDLVTNLQYVNNKTPVAVVSFVMLDSDYNQHSLLGNQLAESLIHEVHKFGIPVIDFKTTGFIRITPEGDFAFSKDYTDFAGELPARYLVGGTLVRHQSGYLVNARIVGVNSKAVVASAQSFIPLNVANALLSTHVDNNNQATETMAPTTSDSSVKLTKG